MKTLNDCTAAALAAALYRQWQQIQTDQHLSGNQAARALGRSPAWFSSMKHGGAAGRLRERRELGAARRLFPDLPCWFVPVARFVYLNTNCTSTRGSVPEAIRRTIALPACPPAVQKRLRQVCLDNGWVPINGEPLPSCPVDLRDDILARARVGKLLLPDGLARQIKVAVPFVRHHRHARNAALDYLSAVGTQMWTMNEETGAKEFARAGDIVECDDATINFPVCVPWEIRGDPCSEKYGVKVGRFQWLVAIDVGSRKILGFTWTARPRSSYRGEDCLALLQGVATQHGIPRAWRLEKGVWASHLVADAVKLMGSQRIAVHSPHAKPFIEGLFNSLWKKLSCHFPQSEIGRFRGETEEANRLLVSCQTGAQDPRRHFPMLADVIAAFQEVVAEHNGHTVDSENYGRWVPNERWDADAAARPLAKLDPQSLWLFSPFAQTWKVRGSQAGGRIPLLEGVSIPYVFSAPFLLDVHGATVRCHFDPSAPRCEATVVLVEATGNHRAGEVLGVAWQANDTTSYVRRVMCYGNEEQKHALQALRQNASALRRVTIGIQGGSRAGDAFEARQYVEHELRDGLGGFSRLVKGTEAAPAVEAPALPPPEPTPINFTARTGKIARLPQAIREEVNARLRDGQPGAVLLPWLNGLAAVQEIVRTQFAGAAITKQNLSEHRKRGFSEWLGAQRLQEQPAVSRADGDLLPATLTR